MGKPRSRNGKESIQFNFDTQALICLSGTSRGYYLTGGGIREVVPIWIQLVRIKRLEALGISIVELGVRDHGLDEGCRIS